MNSISRRILEAALRLEKITSTDATRYLLGYVKIEHKKHSFKIGATNGHILVQTKIECDKSEMEDGAFYLSRDDVKLLTKLLKRVKSQPGFDLKDDVMTLDGQLFKLNRSLTHYPDYEQAIPKDEGYDYEISLNAKYISDVAQALFSDKRMPLINIKIKDNKSPFIIEAHRGDNEKSIGVIMPVRNETPWPDIKKE